MKNKGRIFLVDDDELIISMLSRMLMNSGYDVRTATSATNVVSKIKSWSPDIVLLDIRIGDQNGIDILPELAKEDLPTQVVMLTADDTAETAVRAMKLGAADYLTKPFNIDEVKIVLQNIMEQGRLKQEVVYLRKVQSEVFEKEIIGSSRSGVSRIRSSAEASATTILITARGGQGTVRAVCTPIASRRGPERLCAVHQGQLCGAPGDAAGNGTLRI
jgi:DNA-binding NtrC family response regulator